MRFVATAILLLSLIFPQIIRAQEIVPDEVITAKARVLEILAESYQKIPGTETESLHQTIKAEILEGEEKGKIVTIEDDYIKLSVGDKFFLTHTTGEFDGTDIYTVSDPYRLPAIFFFIGLFILCIFVFGGKQGIRGLAALIGSFLFIGFFLLPGIIAGYSPILVSIIVASFIIILGSYVTHGFSRLTTSAVIGMITTVIITGLLAFFAIKFSHLTGFNTEDTVYLNFNTDGIIDFPGLLLGGIIIGLLGVLYDAAIGQAVSVEELHHVGPHLSRKTIFKRALRIGREHIGALINTLAIAYVGVSLPLILLFYSSSSASFLTIINHELFATEIIRTMVGSIGLILTVPITTLIATWMLVKHPQTANAEVLRREEEMIKEMPHKH